MAKQKLPPELTSYFATIGRKGGKARMRTMTPEERKEVAKKAVAGREAKRQQNRKETKSR